MSARASSGRRGEAGFTVVEAMVACVLMAVGILGTLTALEGTTSANTVAQSTEAAAGVAQRELEQVKALPYASVALTAAPTQVSTTNPNDPTYYLGNGCGTGTCYRWSHPDGGTGRTEPLVISPAGDPTPNPQIVTVPSGRDGTLVSVQVYRFITTVQDASCTVAAACNAKRITIAARILSRGVHAPVIVSGVVSDPSGGARQNPLAYSAATCLDQGSSVPCVH